MNSSARHASTSFTSPLAGEVDHRCFSSDDREGGVGRNGSDEKIPASLTLPRKGGGDMLCKGMRR